MSHGLHVQHMISVLDSDFGKTLFAGTHSFTVDICTVATEQAQPRTIQNETHHARVSQFYASTSSSNVVFKQCVPKTVEVRLQEGHPTSNVPSEDVSPFQRQRETEPHQSPITVVVGNIVEEFAGESSAKRRTHC